MENPPKLRTSYKNKILMQLQCRVCLSQSTNIMFDLKDQLQIESKINTSYLEALQRVVSSKVILDKSYPSSICPICASLLKMALQFIIQYETTELKLKEIFNCTTDEADNSDTKEDDYCETKKVKPCVELIYKDKKFDVQEVLVVEDETPNTCDYGGFLNNLGKEVTATFARNQSSKKNHEVSEDMSMISVAVKENDRFVPVKEIKIDPSSNHIEYIIEDTDVDNRKDHNNIEIKNYSLNGSNLESDDENANIEYIEVDLSHDVINNFIIDRSEKVNQCEQNNDKNNLEMDKGRAEGLISGLFQCQICDKIYSTWRKLCIHRRRVHFAKKRTYTCEICGILCESMSAFIHHKLKHNNKRFKCELCDKSYITKNMLKVHQEVHANKRQHLCQVCGANFNYPNALVYHMRLHTGEKSYKCEFCHKMFRMPGGLIRHRRTHTDDRPYKCQFCEKRFRSKGEATTHEHIHTGRRPYACPVCQRTFYKTYNMRVHMLSHTGPYRCRLCPRGLISESLLSLHAKMAHKKDRSPLEGKRWAEANQEVEVGEWTGTGQEAIVGEWAEESQAAEGEGHGVGNDDQGIEEDGEGIGEVMCYIEENVY